jgi:Tn3 transposase DDE domain
VTDRDVRLDLIEEVWDEFVRIASSIRSRECTTVEALTRFGSAARGQPVYDGGVHIGRLSRSIFLIDYFTNTSFRTELQHVLNRGEAVHVVHRAIHVGRIPVELARREDSLSAVSSVLSLLANILMAWNPHMQHARTCSMRRTCYKPLEANRLEPSSSEGLRRRIWRASTCAEPSFSPWDAMQADCSQAWLKIPRRLPPVSSRSEVTTTRLRVDSKSMIYNDINLVSEGKPCHS